MNYNKCMRPRVGKHGREYDVRASRWWVNVRLMREGEQRATFYRNDEQECFPLRFTDYYYYA